MKRAIIFPFLIFYISCAPQMYYFGSYTDTLYKYKKEPNEETLAKHINELEEIIEKSKQKKLRVPPGIYCEYAFYLIQAGKSDDAIRFIDLEETTYPESIVFTKRLKRMINRNISDTTNTVDENE